MIRIHPRKLTGTWDEGFVLDVHTLGSTLVGCDEYGREKFDTKRSALGDLLYRLKYEADKSVSNDILDIVVEFLLKRWRIVQSLDMIVPMPPCDISRRSQPVLELARGVSSRTGVPLSEDALVKVKDVPQLKNVYDYLEKSRLLSETLEARVSRLQGKTVLLMDDLYRSGATLYTASLALHQRGRANAVYVMALTRSRT
jgi:competence protein ComFC